MHTHERVVHILRLPQVDTGILRASKIEVITDPPLIRTGTSVYEKIEKEIHLD